MVQISVRDLFFKMRYLEIALKRKVYLLEAHQILFTDRLPNIIREIKNFILSY